MGSRLTKLSSRPPKGKRSLILLATFALSLGAQTRQTGYTPGQLTAYQQLTRDIYKQLIEINSGDKTGSVTPAAVAMAQRFRDNMGTS